MKDLKEKIIEDPVNKKIFAMAEKSSINLYIVGGYLRDLLIGMEKADRDYVIEGQGAREFAKRMADLLKGSFVDLDVRRDMARVVFEGRILDFSGTIGKRIEEDLERRDFTINSIAWSPERGIIDPFNGIKDIEERIIKAIKKDNFIEDPLRLLRAYRIGAELGMNIEPRTLEMISNLSHLLPKVPGERISSELFKILELSNSFDHLLKTSQTGILEAIFPELIPTKDIPPMGVHHLSVFDHSLETVKQIEVIIIKFPDWVTEHLKEELSSGINRLSVLKLGGLLHDIGKPLTWKINSDGRHRFIGHGRAGAEIIDSISERLRLSNNITETLKVLVRYHLRPLHLIESGPTKRALYRFFRSLDKYCIDITVLSMADSFSIGGSEDEILKKESRLFEILKEFKSFKKEEIEKPRILTGKEIMEILKIEPGPKVGQILNKLREAQILGEVRSKEEAIEYINKYKDKI